MFVFSCTICHILRLTCTKFNFRWGSAPEPVGGAYSASRLPSCIQLGLFLRGGRERGRDGREKGNDKGRKGKRGTGIEGRGDRDP